MRALVVGLGSIGKCHAANIRSLCSSVELILLRRQVRDKKEMKALDLETVYTMDTAIRARPDFAVIATPSHLHIDALVPLLESSIPCYIEKPVVTRREDVDRLYRLLNRMAVVPVTLAGCNMRFLPALVKLRSLVQSGVIGNIVRAMIQVGQWLPDWRPHQDYTASYSTNSELGGGVILDLIHELDAARWLFGEFDKVLALAGKLSTLRIESEDTACVLLGKSRGGPLVAVNLDYVSRRAVRRYEVVGEKGTLVWDLGASRLELTSSDGVESIDCGEHGFDVARTYVTAMTEFLTCVRRNRPTSQTMLEGLRTVELALHAKAAAGL